MGWGWASFFVCVYGLDVLVWMIDRLAACVPGVCVFWLICTNAGVK
jgi:hypothetical protein